MIDTETDTGVMTDTEEDPDQEVLGGEGPGVEVLTGPEEAIAEGDILEVEVDPEAGEEV